MAGWRNIACSHREKIFSPLQSVVAISGRLVRLLPPRTFRAPPPSYGEYSRTRAPRRLSGVCLGRQIGRACSKTRPFMGTARSISVRRWRRSTAGEGFTVGGSTALLAESHVALPPGFAAPAPSAALANTIVYDAQMFPFYYDLARSFRVGDTSADGMLGDFLSSLGKSSSVSLGGANASLHFVHDDVVKARRDAREGDDRSEELDTYRFSMALAPGVSATVGQGFGSIGSSNDFIAARTNRTIIGDAFSVAPFAVFAGRGSELTVGWRVDDATTFRPGGQGRSRVWRIVERTARLARTDP